MRITILAVSMRRAVSKALKLKQKRWNKKSGKEQQNSFPDLFTF